MASPSEEIWESFNALWRQVQQLNRQVSDLKAWLAVIERARAQSPEDGFQPKVDTSASPIYYAKEKCTNERSG